MRKILSGLFAWTLVSMLTGCEEQPVREYSMLDRWIEDGLTDVLRENQVGCICFAPLIITSPIRGMINVVI